MPLLSKHHKEEVQNYVCHFLRELLYLSKQVPCKNNLVGCLIHDLQQKLQKRIHY